MRYINLLTYLLTYADVYLRQRAVETGSEAAAELGRRPRERLADGAAAVQRRGTRVGTGRAVDVGGPVGEVGRRGRVGGGGGGGG